MTNYLIFAIVIIGDNMKRKVIMVIVMCILLSGCSIHEIFMGIGENKVKNHVVRMNKNMSCYNDDSSICADFTLSEDGQSIIGYDTWYYLKSYSEYEYNQLLSSGKTRSQIKNDLQSLATNKVNELKSHLNESDYKEIKDFVYDERCSVSIDYSDTYIKEFIQKHNMTSVDDLIRVVESGEADGVKYKCNKYF